MEILIEIAAAAGGSLGFALLFRIKGFRLLLCAAAGAVVWSVYLGVLSIGLNFLVANTIAAMIGTMISEIFARIFHSPATSFIAPTVIPLIPGGTLFDALQALIAGNMSQAGSLGVRTASIAAVIAAGIYASSVFFRPSSHIAVGRK